MDRRSYGRLPANLQVRATQAGDHDQSLTGTVIDISEAGMCALLPLEMVAGAPVTLNAGDSVFQGHVMYAIPHGLAFRTGIVVERVLLGTSELSDLLRAIARPSLFEQLRPIDNHGDGLVAAIGQR